jgi:iron(III) transport system permease protein
VSLALVFLAAELRLQGRARFTQMESGWRPAPRVSLGRWRGPALLAAIGVVAVALLVPLGTLVAWTAQALLDPAKLDAVLNSSTRPFGSFVWNSVWTASLAALVAVALSMPVARLAVRHGGPAATVISRLCQVGYAIPGVVIALSLLLLVNRGLPFLYATPLVVVIAYTLRYMPQAVRSSESALGQLAPSLEEAARSLGRTPLRVFFEVTLPLILPGALAGGALVFLTSLKELPATLLLRPAGFDTLAVRVWTWANDGFYAQAAPAALLLALASAIPLAFLLRREPLFR